MAFLKEQGRPEYDESILVPRDDGSAAEDADNGDRDEVGPADGAKPREVLLPPPQL